MQTHLGIKIQESTEIFKLQAVLLCGLTNSWIGTIADHAGIYHKFQSSAVEEIGGDVTSREHSDKLEFIEEIKAQHAYIMLLHEVWQVQTMPVRAATHGFFLA